MTDTIQRFLFEHAPVRGEIVHLDATWRAVLSRHDYPLPVRALLQVAPLLVLFAFFVSSVLTGISALARTFKEGQALLGPVQILFVLPGLAGSLPGIFVGSYFAIRIPERALRLVLATTLFMVATRIAYDHATTASSIFTAFSGRAVP